VRKLNKKITDESVLEAILESCHTGRLGTVGPDGWPMVKPLSFAYYEGRIYFHCALEGEKLDHIRHDDRVCFEVDLPIAYIRGTTENPCRAEYLYRSAIIKGRASIVDDRDERLLALDRLMAKYQPDGGYGSYPEEKLALTCIVRIDMAEMSGKEDLGKGDIKEQVLQLLKSKEKLPVIIA
jgi:nitroimidazol reductase NimA-like FMN-containing flavoprotein (pyridoxamine 5'-phosphate oxidase superfamily)